MHRWSGNETDSEKQAAARTSRAARRTISRLPEPTPSSDEDDFKDCDTSILFSNLDGADDPDTSGDEMSAAAELARQRALPIEDSDFDNDEDSWKKEIKIKFNQQDVNYWFNTVEAQMKTFGINRQWDKKSSIVPLLPENVVEECRGLAAFDAHRSGRSARLISLDFV